MRPENMVRAPLAEIRLLSPISIVIPTYREAENITLMIDRVAQLRDALDIDIELLFMDDDSRDGSVELVTASGFSWASIVVRTKDRGLSQAVVDGMRRAHNPILICMDCDLSHPPERIPEMILALSSGQQMVIGSRYVPGGTTDDNWGFGRYIISRVATLMAWPLASVRDPMSGFFALRRDDFLLAEDLNPIGYKIALELIVKCGFKNISEIPIHFTNRVYGESKLSLREQFKYIQHLRRLYIYKFANAMHLLQFLVVGGIGTVVNLVVLTVLNMLGAAGAVSIAGGISVSVIGNFFLNRRFTFSYARGGNIWRQFGGFITASAVGLVINYFVAVYLANTVLKDEPFGLQLAALIGIACGMVFNFLGNRFVVFRKRHVVEPRKS